MGFINQSPIPDCIVQGAKMSGSVLPATLKVGPYQLHHTLFHLSFKCCHLTALVVSLFMIRLPPAIFCDQIDEYNFMTKLVTFVTAKPQLSDKVVLGTNY
jgi:hypothetical protein